MNSKKKERKKKCKDCKFYVDVGYKCNKKCLKNGVCNGK